MSYLPAAVKCDSDCQKTSLNNNGKDFYCIYRSYTDNTKSIIIAVLDKIDPETTLEEEKHACSPECTGRIISIMLKGER